MRYDGTDGIVDLFSPARRLSAASWLRFTALTGPAGSLISATCKGFLLATLYLAPRSTDSEDSLNKFD